MPHAPRDPDSDTLLAAARGGDRRALEALLEKHQAQVYRFGVRMCRDPEDAKDVLQETLLAAARGVRDFRGASSISTWLYTIARSFCIKQRRRDRRGAESARSLDEESSAVVARVADPAKSADEALAGKQVEQALEQAIGGLEPAYREVLVLRDLEGLSAVEVAEVLGLSVQAVKSRLHRARLSVRERVAPLLGIGAEPAPATSGGCPDVLTLFSRHVEDELSPQICAEMERHLAECGRCRGTCDSLRRTLALCKTVPSAEVPESIRNSVRVALQSFLAEKA